MKRLRSAKQSWDNRIFSFSVYVVVILITIMCAVPFINLLAISLSSTSAVQRGQVFLIPKELNISVYKSILSNMSFLRSMGISVLLTFTYVIISVTLTICCAYPLSIPELKGKQVILPFIMFTMYFSGGLIPHYLLVDSLGLIDSYWALVLPCALSTYNMIVMRSFFVSIPISLREAALIDGAGDFKVLMSVVLPLSKPSIATISLFYAVSRWNGMQDALLYINDPRKKVLQIYLKQMIQSVEGFAEIAAEMEERPILETVRAGSLMVSLIPVMIIYPFLQKYFVKGVMVGSVKG